MKLHFRNETASVIWVAVMFYSPEGCKDAGQWGTRGWWTLNPGGEAYVLKTDHRYSAYYAESSDGSMWSGHYGPVYVHPQGFDSCVDIGDNNPTTRIVHMRLIDSDADNHYVNLFEHVLIGAVV